MSLTSTSLLICPYLHPACDPPSSSSSSLFVLHPLPSSPILSSASSVAERREADTRANVRRPGGRRVAEDDDTGRNSET